MEIRIGIPGILQIFYSNSNVLEWILSCHGLCIELGRRRVSMMDIVGKTWIWGSEDPSKYTRIYHSQKTELVEHQPLDLVAPKSSPISSWMFIFVPCSYCILITFTAWIRSYVNEIDPPYHWKLNRKKWKIIDSMDVPYSTKERIWDIYKE